MPRVDPYRRETELHVHRPFAGRERQALAYVDQGYTGEKPAAEAEAEGIRLEVVKRPETERSFVLLPRRWVVERDFSGGLRASSGAWSRIMSGCQPRHGEGLDFVAFACLWLRRAITALGLST